MNGKRKPAEIDLAVERVDDWLAKRPCQATGSSAM